MYWLTLHRWGWRTPLGMANAIGNGEPHLEWRTPLVNLEDKKTKRHLRTSPNTTKGKGKDEKE